MLSVGQQVLERYEIKQAFSPTVYLAHDTQTRQAVCLKTLVLSLAQNWKQLELFEREARALRYLKHPRIPKLLNFQRRDHQNDVHLYLVTEYISGLSLAQRLEQGWRCSLQEALQLAQQLLDILIYLHEQHPPLVHRDLKPSNLLLNQQGELFLVDFGGIQIRGGHAPGSTVMGTFGYMAPEQFSGQATVRSDLYALGATWIHLLSGHSPAEMPYQGLRLRYQNYLPAEILDHPLSLWLSQLLQAEPQKRIASARAASQALKTTTPHTALCKALAAEGIQSQRNGQQFALRLPHTVSLKQQQHIQIPFWLCLLVNLGSLFFWADLNLQGKASSWFTISLLSTLSLNALLSMAWYRQHLHQQFQWNLSFEPESVSLSRQYKDKSYPIFQSPAVQAVQITNITPGQSALNVQTDTENKNFELGYEIPENTCKHLNLLLEQSLHFSHQRHTI